MYKIFASIHLDNIQSSNPINIITLPNIDFQKSVLDLKRIIVEKLNTDSEEDDAEKLEIIFNGLKLQDENKLDDVLRPNGIVQCFRKTKQYTPYTPSEDFTTAKAIETVENLFHSIAHIQISVNSRVNILQKILAEYPEFRRNLGAQALIRDSVLFNTLHEKCVIQNIAMYYPIICEAASFIIDTIRKELRDATNLMYRETAADSPNSSEEENSLGASSSNNSLSDNTSTQNEESRIRSVTRQQLERALAQVQRTNMNSINSLSNIAQRNADSNTTAAVGSTSSNALSTSASGERISQEMFRHELARVLNTLAGSQPSVSGSANRSSVGGSQRIHRNNADEPQHMDTSDDHMAGRDLMMQDYADDEHPMFGDIPFCYRGHQYAEQLRIMAQMGFTNHAENITFLDITNGNIENALNLLMAAMN